MNDYRERLRNIIGDNSEYEVELLILLDGAYSDGYYNGESYGRDSAWEDMMEDKENV